MTHPPFFARVATAFIVVASTCAKVRGQDTNVVVWASAVRQMRFLYAGMRTEFAGCLYGYTKGDSVIIRYFVPGAIDPRTASDSSVQQGPCPDIHDTLSPGAHFLAVVHSHMRRGSVCVPSQNRQPPAGNDVAVYKLWRRLGALFGVIMCAGGDSLALFTDTHLMVIGVGPLDSLFQRKP